MAGRGEKRAKHIQQENRAFRLAFENARDAIFWADPKKATIVRCNRAARRLLGRTKAELIGQSIAIIHPPEEVRKNLKLFRDRVLSSSREEIEAIVMRKSGKRRSVLIAVSLLALEDGPVLQGIFNDVTEHRAMEQALRESEENFRALAENATEAIVIEAEDRAVYANQAALRLIDRTAGQMRKLSTYDLIVPAERPRVAAMTKQRLAGKPAPSRYESAIATPDGREIPVEVTAASTTWHGKPATIGMLRDISERRLQEQAIVERDQMIARAEAVAGVGSWYRRFDSDRALISDGLLSIYGLTRDQVDGSEQELQAAFFGAIHPDDRAMVEADFHNLMTKYVDMKYECRLLREDGAERVVHSVGMIDWDSDGKPVGAVGAVWDITDRVLMEQDLVEVSRREQERIGQDLHDGLGQELLGISFLAKALERKTSKSAPEVSAEARRLSELAGRSLRQARRLARGLLPVEMDEGALASELRYLSRNIREAHDISCSCRVWEPGLVHDNKAATHLYLIAREAVANAIRHGKADRIRIDLHTGAQGKLTIRDNGTWPEEAGDGHGIGLRTMQHRASLIGGRCRVAHSEKKGTTVTCTFRNSRP